MGVDKMMTRREFVFALALPVACAFARTQEIALWRGETQAFRLQDFAHVSGEVPHGVTMRLGVLRDVDYRESPEAVRWQKMVGTGPFGGGDFGLETAQYCKITEKK